MKSFAEKAVRTLSSYPDVDEDDLKPRVALAGLILMVCESARFNPLLKYFQDHWTDTQYPCSCKNLKRPGFSQEEMNYIWSWGKISRAQLLWKDRRYRQWSLDDKKLMLKDIITTEVDALRAVHLVFNSDTRKIQVSICFPFLNIWCVLLL